jgi:hypothetical protein
VGGLEDNGSPYSAHSGETESAVHADMHGRVERAMLCVGRCWCVDQTEGLDTFNRGIWVSRRRGRVQSLSNVLGC